MASSAIIKNNKERDSMIQAHPLSCPCCGDPATRVLTRRRFLALAAEGAAALALLPHCAYADTDTTRTIAYDSVPNPLHLPRDTYFGECSGVALNS
jgi:hypothetical protein